MFKRAAKQRIKLTLADLVPCHLNLLYAPASWFEIFAADESAPPKNLAEWEAAFQFLSPQLLRWLRPKQR
jgi:hypothetical protein